MGLRGVIIFHIGTVLALLHRTDFFPGLGWLLTKKIWNEIKSNWPKGFVGCAQVVAQLCLDVL